MVTGLTFTDEAGKTVTVHAKHLVTADDKIVINEGQLVTPLSELPSPVVLKDAAIMTVDQHTGKLFLDDVTEYTVPSPATATVDRQVELDASSDAYNAAGNWVGILFAVQAISSVL